jgi:hypothetical protein
VRAGAVRHLKFVSNDRRVSNKQAVRRYANPNLMKIWCGARVHRKLTPEESGGARHRARLVDSALLALGNGTAGKSIAIDSERRRGGVRKSDLQSHLYRACQFVPRSASARACMNNMHSVVI